MAIGQRPFILFGPDVASGPKYRKDLSLSECSNSFVFVLKHISTNFAKGLCFGAYHMILLRKRLALHPICVSSNNPPFNYNRPQATHNNTPGTNPKLHHGQIQYCKLKIKGYHRSGSGFYTCNKQKKVNENFWPPPLLLCRLYSTKSEIWGGTTVGFQLTF